DLVSVRHEAGNHTFGGFGLLAEELGRADALLDGKPERLGLRLPRSGPGGARLFALALHRRVEGVSVDGDAARLERILRQVEGKAVGVVERERGLAGKLRAARKSLAAVFEQSEPALQGLA